MDAFGAEADAKPAQSLSLRWCPRGDWSRNGGHRQASERAEELIDKPSANTTQRQYLCAKKRRQPALDVVAQKFMKASAHLLARLPLEEVSGKRLRPRRQQLFACHHSADHCAAPTQLSVGADCEGFVGIHGEKPRAGGDLATQNAASGRDQHPHLDTIDRIGNKAQTIDAADISALDENLTRLGYGGDQLALASQLADQERRSPVDQALCNAFVQRVRKPIRDTAGALLPLP